MTRVAGSIKSSSWFLFPQVTRPPLVISTPLHVSCNPAVRKVLIRLGKSLFLESGKATTRVKRRITAAFESTDLQSASPRGNSEETVLLL